MMLRWWLSWAECARHTLRARGVDAISTLQVTGLDDSLASVPELDFPLL